MSSRAIRKLQRESEKQQEEHEGVVDSGSVSDEDEGLKPAAKNAFDMLNEVETEDDVDDEDIDEAETDTVDREENRRNETGDATERTIGSNQDKPTAKKPKKKKKGKKKPKNDEKTNVTNQASQAAQRHPELDEIDLALQSLSTKPQGESATSSGPIIDAANAQLFSLLAVESKHLNALNEMKRLFGNVVMEHEEEAAATPRRRGRGLQGLNIEEALSAQHSPVSQGQGLKGLALRRNVFIMGKEEWPQATSGGLGMELVEKMEDGTVEYRFIHNSIYQDVQRQFESCVESLDPQRMIALLQYNPYHISTLLQVSEIAKQQGDQSVSSDLLERALFTFGRSVHSSFSKALSEGKARLDFRRPENREFWLAAWRYLTSLGQRGTWRTSYEWARLILSLDPEGDPYCVSKILDQLALRGGRSEHYIQLSRNPFFSEDLWSSLPNPKISIALAQYRLKQAQDCRASLSQAISQFPWIFARLFKELNLEHIPKSIWGSTPRTDREKFDCEVYVHNAKDLWSTPEATSLLVEVAETTTSSTPPEPDKTSVNLDEARHVLLSGTPALINLLPRSFTSMQTTASDPLPPPDDLPSYNPSSGQEGPIYRQAAYNAAAEDNDGDEDEEELPAPGIPNQTTPADASGPRGLRDFITSLVPWLSAAPTAEGPANGQTSRQTPDNSAPEMADMTSERRDRIVAIARRIAHGEDSDNVLAALREELQTMGIDPETELAAELDNTPYQAQETAPNDDDESEAYDDERNQRWLAGQGMLRLRDFTAAHGVDETEWPANSGQEIVVEYARRALQLRQQKTRQFIINYPLRQGTSQAVKELVERAMVAAAAVG